MTSVVEVDALVFDVFGTVVDWRAAVISEGRALSDEHGLEVDWPSFADRWRREGYLGPIQEMVAGGRPWAPIDTVLRDHLDRLAGDYGFAGVGTVALDRLAGVWERLDPWPDAVAGLDRLRARYVIGPLSNATFGALTRMARRAGLGWDCIIATELFGTYKPDPRTYLGAAGLLRLPPERVMLVAAHPNDLDAARSCGLRSAYVPRPLEWGARAAARDERRCRGRRGRGHRGRGHRGRRLRRPGRRAGGVTPAGIAPTCARNARHYRRPGGSWTSVYRRRARKARHPPRRS